jgi:hypothetical protein
MRWLVWFLPGLGFAQTDLGAIVPAREPVRAIAIGDFGDLRPRERFFQQVADAILAAHRARPYRFGITLGDNFYNAGMKSVADRKWELLWERPFGRIGIPFYATLGNHDYRGNPQAQVDYTQRSRTWRMPARYYTFAAGPVRFVALDTEEWSAAQAAWLREQLARPARFRVVYGHHPVLSYGHHGADAKTRNIRAALLPLLRGGRADLYLAGHDHDLQHLKLAGIDLVVCGGGGANTRDTRRGPETLFARSAHGFCELEAEAQHLVLRIRGVDGRTYTEFRRP